MPQQDMKTSDRTHYPVSLFTSTGQHVVDVKVPSGLLPGIITWGGRSFVRRHGAFGEVTVFDASVGG